MESSSLSLLSVWVSGSEPEKSTTNWRRTGVCVRVCGPGPAGPRPQLPRALPPPPIPAPPQAPLTGARPSLQEGPSEGVL